MQLLHICAMDMDKYSLSDKPGRGSLPWASAASAASISARRGGTSSLGVGGGWGAGLGGPRTLLPWPGTKRWKWIGWGLPSTSTKKGGGIRCGSVCVWNKVHDNLIKSPLKVCCKWSYRHPARFFFLTLYAVRVISIKFLLVISILCKTEWSWELRIYRCNHTR